MKRKLILIPALLGSIYLSGCAGLGFGGLATGATSGSDSYDDSSVRNQDALNEQAAWDATEQMVNNQAAIDSSNALNDSMAATASAAAAAALNQ